jgi:hypothetical protein
MEVSKEAYINNTCARLFAAAAAAAAHLVIWLCACRSCSAVSLLACWWQVELPHRKAHAELLGRLGHGYNRGAVLQWRIYQLLALQQQQQHKEQQQQQHTSRHGFRRVLGLAMLMAAKTSAMQIAMMRIIVWELNTHGNYSAGRSVLSKHIAPNNAQHCDLPSTLA